MPSTTLTASAPSTNLKLSRLNGWPTDSPVNASPCTSRCTTHDSGPVWFAIPSLHRTLTCYSLPISRRTSVRKFPFLELSPNYGLNRNGDLEDGAASTRASAAPHSNRSAMALNNPPRDSQAEACASILLGCEERLEDTIHVLIRNAVPVVSDNKVHLAPPLPETETQGASWRESIESIVDQIGENLKHLTRINRGDDLVGKVFHQPHLFSLDRLLMYPQCGLGQLNQVHRSGANGGPCKAKGTISNVECDGHLLICQGGVFADFVRIVCFYRCQVGEVPQRFERVSNVVHHFECELSGRCPFFGLPQSFGGYCQFVLQVENDGVMHSRSPVGCAGENAVWKALRPEEESSADQCCLLPRCKHTPQCCIPDRRRDFKTSWDRDAANKH
ncbi:hypothetical protein ACPOL_2674 [Acidisarcina polymorpha]|uniref:Uncharacterized protein n=1 Tax=Acidisarcina polymorpha TaxID=2211140 RepID=A0A2Z5FZR6_9BACT|nr:hypothetical protein ACPOL_2674 [Acidisarcina polymorpha]